MSKAKKQRRESSDSAQEESSSSSSDSSSSSSSSSSDSSKDIKNKKSSTAKVRRTKSSSMSSHKSCSSSESDSDSEMEKRKRKVTKKCKQAKKPHEEKHPDHTSTNQKYRSRRREDRVESSITNKSKWDSPSNEYNEDQRDRNRDRRHEDYSRNDRSRQMDRRDNDSRNNRYPPDNRYRNRQNNRNWDRDRDHQRRSPDHRQDQRNNRQATRENNRQDQRDKNRRDFNDRRNNNDRGKFHDRSPRRGRNFPRRTDDDNNSYEWGKRNDASDKDQSDQPPVEKEKPNFGLSGKLTEDTNKVNGIVIKYAEPLEARKPKRRWRLYPFKGEKALATMYIHRQSCYLIGRDRKVCDLPVDHPSCSKQHAALQYRLVPFDREDGTVGKRVRPYIIDLESANGTFINNKQIDAKKYIELLEKDVIKFGFSSREYVLLHENSKEDQLDDDVILEEIPVKEEPVEV